MGNIKNFLTIKVWVLGFIFRDFFKCMTKGKMVIEEKSKEKN